MLIYIYPDSLLEGLRLKAAQPCYGRRQLQPPGVAWLLHDTTVRTQAASPPSTFEDAEMCTVSVVVPFPGGRGGPSEAPKPCPEWFYMSTIAVRSWDRLGAKGKTCRPRSADMLPGTKM